MCLSLCVCVLHNTLAYKFFCDSVPMIVLVWKSPFYSDFNMQYNLIISLSHAHTLFLPYPHREWFICAPVRKCIIFLLKIEQVKVFFFGFFSVYCHPHIFPSFRFFTVGFFSAFFLKINYIVCNDLYFNLYLFAYLFLSSLYVYIKSNRVFVVSGYRRRRVRSSVWYDLASIVDIGLKIACLSSVYVERKRKNFTMQMNWHQFVGIFVFSCSTFAFKCLQPCGNVCKSYRFTCASKIFGLARLKSFCRYVLPEKWFDGTNIFNSVFKWSKFTQFICIGCGAKFNFWTHFNISLLLICA